MTVTLAPDALHRIATAPTPLEWDVSFIRSDSNTWTVIVHLAAERDPYTSKPDPVIATGTVRADVMGNAHRFNIRGSETFPWFGGDPTLAALAHQIIDEVTR